ncbi:MAG: adenosylcobinamide-GDP ribazoletransferase, partial [Gemmobacter sp.]
CAVAVTAAALWLPPLALAAGWGGLALGHAAMRRVYERRLGGYTGDCLGAVQQCSEIGFLIGLVAWL